MAVKVVVERLSVGDMLSPLIIIVPPSVAKNITDTLTSKNHNPAHLSSFTDSLYEHCAILIFGLAPIPISKLYFTLSSSILIRRVTSCDRTDSLS